MRAHCKVKPTREEEMKGWALVLPLIGTRKVPRRCLGTLLLSFGYPVCRLFDRLRSISFSSVADRHGNEMARLLRCNLTPGWKASFSSSSFFLLKISCSNYCDADPGGAGQDDGCCNHRTVNRPRISRTPLSSAPRSKWLRD